MVNTYTVRTDVRHALVPGQSHVKSYALTRKGYRNDTYAVSCSCGAQEVALTYARKGK